MAIYDFCIGAGPDFVMTKGKMNDPHKAEVTLTFESGAKASMVSIEVKFSDKDITKSYLQFAKKNRFDSPSANYSHTRNMVFNQDGRQNQTDCRYEPRKPDR